MKKEYPGVTIKRSSFPVKETIDKLQALLEKNGSTIYARIDQQAELRKANLEISPLEFLLFGNPEAGGKLIMENPLVALDLPLKFIAWEDDSEKVWVAYNSSNYIKERFVMKPTLTTPLVLDNLVEKALKKS